MPANLYLKCPECQMTFNSHSMLQKHRTKFCVGALTNADMYSARNQPEAEYTPRASEDRTNRQRQLQMAAESHGRNLVEYQSRSHQLERQKQEIDRRLETINDGDSYVMTQLQLQENRNHRTLRELKRSVKGMKGGRPTSPNTLLAQIHAMRQSYLRQGGSNPGMLQQIAEMEQEAMNMGHKGHKKHKSKARYDSLMEQVLAFELENNRLQKELMLIQERNNEHMLLKRTAEEAGRRAFEREMERHRQREREKSYLEHMSRASKQSRLSHRFVTLEPEEYEYDDY